MSDDGKKRGEQEPKTRVDESKRDLMKGAAAAVAATGVLAGAAGTAQADRFREGASRYIPPGQWPHHLELEWYEFPSDDPKVVEVWGYTDNLSYKPGDEVSFHMSTGAPTFDIKIYRDGGKLEEVHAATGVPGKRTQTPKDAYAVGCGWPALYKWRLPRDLRSGFYLVVFSIKRGDKSIEQEAGFCVRPASRKSSLVYILPTATWHAYNDWAGGNYYGLPGGLGGATDLSDTTGPLPTAAKIHLHRPWARGFMRSPNSASRFMEPTLHRPMGHMIRYYDKEFALSNGYSKWSPAAGWANYDRHFAMWAENNGYEPDYITQHDLQNDPSILNGYKCAVLIGHDEYWSWDQRKALDDWIEAGGHLARFAGNMNWQVRYEEGSLVQVCYKSYGPNLDPVRDDPENKHLVTVPFDDIRYGKWTTSQTFAASSVFGHMVGVGGASPRSPGFTVYRPSHWMLEGTDLYYGDVFGTMYNRFECDGVPYTFKNGYPYPTDFIGTPTNIEIAAMFPTTNGEDSRPPEHSPFQQGGSVEYRQGNAEHVYGKPLDQLSQEQKESMERGCGILAYMPKGQGEVATAAVTDWCFGLGKDPYIDKITHNILKRFTA